MTIGVYKIKCLPNDKVYIGSSRDIESRKAHHFSELRNDRHHNIKMAKDFKYYKEFNFSFEILETIDNVDDLFIIEQKYIDEIPEANRYNLHPTAGSPRNYTHSDEYKKRLSEIRVGEGNSRATLTESQVIEIKKLLIKDELDSNQIAAMFDTNRHAISDIKTKRSWKHVYVEGEESIEIKRKTMLNDELVREIKRDIANKVKYKEIASKYNIGRCQIDRLVSGQIFSHVEV